jgi:hypothetical protein
MIDAPLPVKDGVQPLNLDALRRFFESGEVPESARITDDKQLFLLGTKPAHRPTLDGHRVSLADLAVAYRAARYSGLNSVYMSLDPSGVPEMAAVNFGGRLHDTRIGAVALRCDQRLKTLADGIELHAHAMVADQIRQTMPDFLTQTERMFRDPVGKTVKSEKTRFWFYPDTLGIERDGDRALKITSPRYTAAAERTDAGGIPGRRADQTPAWTTDTLKHFNANYPLFAERYEELLELDDVGRLLLLGTWLADLHERGRLPFDADSLLGVELPRCVTPRQVPQTLLSLWVKDGQPPTLLVSDVSYVAEEMRRARRSGQLDEAWNRLDLLDRLLTSRSDYERTVLRMGLVKAGEAELPTVGKQAGLEKRELGAFEGFSVVTGGLTLDLRQTLRIGPPIRPEELERIQAGGTRITGGSGKGPPPPPPVAHSIPDPDPKDPRRGRSIPGTGQLVVGLLGDRDKPNGQSVRPASPNSDQPARSIFEVEIGETRAPTMFSLYENGESIVYRLTTVGDRVVAAREQSSPRSADADALAAAWAIRDGRSPQYAWQVLAEGTPVLAVERLSDGSVGVLTQGRRGADSAELRVVKDNRVEVVAHGPEASAQIRAAARDFVRRASGDTATFVYAEPNGEKVRLHVGAREPVEMSRADVARLIANPTSPIPNALDAVFRGSDPSKDFIIYRDAFARRPERHGGSLRKGSAEDPLAWGAALQERFRKDGVRTYLDDLPIPATRRLKELPTIQDTGIALLIRDGDYLNEKYAARERAALNGVKAAWAAANLKVVERIEDANGIGNIGVLTGENSRELFNYMQELGERGLLKDRVWLFLTCGEDGNPNMFHELLDRYEAKAIVAFPEQLLPETVAEVLRKVPQVLTEAQTQGTRLNARELIDKAAEAIEQDRNRPPSIRKQQELRRLRRGILQLSDARTPGRFFLPTVYV